MWDQSIFRTKLGSANGKTTQTQLQRGRVSHEICRDPQGDGVRL